MERYGIDLNQESKSEQNKNGSDEGQIQDLLKDRPYVDENDYEATQPRLESSNPIDTEKNHRE